MPRRFRGLFRFSSSLFEFPACLRFQKKWQARTQLWLHSRFFRNTFLSRNWHFTNFFTRKMRPRKQKEQTAALKYRSKRLVFCFFNNLFSKRLEQKANIPFQLIESVNNSQSSLCWIFTKYANAYIGLAGGNLAHAQGFLLGCKSVQGHGGPIPPPKLGHLRNNKN